MGDLSVLKAAVVAAIRTNGNQEITGQVLQNTLTSIINTLGTGAQYMGIATPTTNPGTPDAKVFYIASANGTYTNFGGITVENEVVILSNTSGNWVKQSTGLATLNNITQLDLKSVAYNALEGTDVHYTGEVGIYYEVSGGKVKTTTSSTSKSTVISATDGTYLIRTYCSGARRIVVTDNNGNAEQSFGGESAYLDYTFNIVGDKKIYISGVNNNEYPILITKCNSLTSEMISAIKNVAYSGYLMSPCNTDRINAVVNANQSIDITIKAGTYSIYNNKGGHVNIVISSDSVYNIPAAYTLIYDDSDKSVKVVAINRVSLTDGSIILAHNERGVVPFGALSNFIIYNTFKDIAALTNCIVTPFNSDSIEWSKNGNTIFITFKKTTYSLYKSNGGYFNIRFADTPTTFEIPAAYTLIYDASDNNVKVVAINRSALTNGTIILAHNERGNVYNGLLSGMFSSSKLNGKKICFLGDSITEYHTYMDALVIKNGITVYNRGSSGTTMAKSRVAHSFCERVDYPESNTLVDYNGGMPSDSNIDIFVVYGGTNDFSLVNSGTPFGDIHAVATQDTFCGSVHYIIQKLKAKYPTKPLVMLTPMHMQGNDAVINAREWDLSEGVYTEHQNTNGNHVLSDYIEAEKAIAQMYGVTCVDMRNVGFGALIEAERNRYYKDGLHPNADGGARMADYLIPILESVLPK